MKLCTFAVMSTVVMQYTFVEHEIEIDIDEDEDEIGLVPTEEALKEQAGRIREVLEQQFGRCEVFSTAFPSDLLCVSEDETAV